MASIEDRWWRPARDDAGNPRVDERGKPVLEKTDRHGVGLRWLLRWREPDGRERKKSFVKKVDAEKHAATVEADKLRGTYLDPDAGKELLETYARTWLSNQTTDPLTRENIDGRLRRYVEGTTLGRTPLRGLRPGTVQGWVRGLVAVPLAPSTIRTVFAHVSAIMNAAVEDDMIRRNPCRSSSVRLPAIDAKHVEPWAREWVTGMAQALAERYQVLATLGAGLGLRQGELFGLSPDDVDFLRGWVTVQRQVKIVGNKLVFALPKGHKMRRVPLPASVRDELAAHLAAWPAKAVTLPWETSEGKPTTVTLVSTTRESGASNRNHFNTEVWRPALTKVGIPHSRENGCHALRHFYASALLDAGENIKAVSEYLGHASAAFTLSTYAHLMPASEARTRAAIDAVFGACAPSVPQGTGTTGLTSTESQKVR